MILVTGATGNLGSAVVNELLNRVEAKDIAVLVRDEAKVAGLKQKGVQVKVGSYDNYNSLVEAFKGINSLLLVSGNDMANRIKQHENVVKAAKEANVGRVVYTSTQRVTEGKESAIAFFSDSHIATEKMIKESGLSFTILKDCLYMEVLPLFMGDKVIETGTIYLPAEDGKVAFASRADMAQGAAIVLSSKGHENKVYEFGNEIAVGFDEIAQILSKLSGKEITYVSPTQEDFVKTLKEIGVPQEGIAITAGFSKGIAEGELNTPTHDLKDLLGHELISLQTYLKGAYNL
ncbi:SDR family oxidoreductase [Zhouia sp. PK063]|uniref:SDR family oxidoreductase n=1 Tax=Zhouia sp. PK063 TaxID=3373602 RepID=UPI0037A6F15D